MSGNVPRRGRSRCDSEPSGHLGHQESYLLYTIGHNTIVHKLRLLLLQLTMITVHSGGDDPAWSVSRPYLELYFDSVFREQRPALHSSPNLVLKARNLAMQKPPHLCNPQ